LFDGENKRITEHTSIVKQRPVSYLMRTLARNIFTTSH